jgi:hypothetical protein
MSSGMVKIAGDGEFAKIRRNFQRIASTVLGPQASPTFAGLTLTNLTASRLMASDSAKALSSVGDLTLWVAGTANRVTVADDGDGTITLSGPQDIHTGASPTFAGLTIVNTINEFSTDGTMGGNSDSAVPTEKATKLYTDTLRSDLASVANAKGASLVGVEDSAAQFDATDVETALSELMVLVTPVEYNPTMTRTTGGDAGGDDDSVATIDDADSYDTDEVGGTPGFDIQAVFSGVTDFNQVQIHTAYDGNPAHIIRIDLDKTPFNWSSYDTILADIDDNSGNFVFNAITVASAAQYINSGEVRLRFYHSSAGNATHDFFIDYCALWKTGASVGVTEHGGLTGLDDVIDHPSYLLLDGSRALAGAWDMGSQALTNVNVDSGDIHNDVTHTQWDAAYTHSQLTHDYSYISGNDGATDVTAAQLEELSDASETTLHSHAGGGGGSVLHKARMTRDAAQSIPNNSWTKILFDAETYDVGGIADYTTNDRFNILATGYYHITASWSTIFVDNFEVVAVAIRIDGTDVRNVYVQPADTNSWAVPVVIDTAYITSGSYVEMWVFHNEGSAQNTRTELFLKPAMSVVQLTEQEGSDRKVKIDIGATADFIGAASNDGVLRTSAPLIYTDGGNFVTLSLDAGLTDLATVAMAADKFYYTSADNTHVAGTVTAFARTILDDVDEATFKATVNLQIGTDVLAEQTIGIADDNLLEVDDADAADNDYAKFTAAGLEGRDYSEVLTDLSGQAGAAFAWNSQNLTGIGTVGCGAVTGTSTAIFEGASVSVGKASTTTGTIVLHDSNSANTITLTVPDISAGSLSFTLPPTDGANTNVLQTDGNGVLTWVAAGGGGGGTWISLTDTDPANYTDDAGKFVRVNAGEDGLEFHTLSNAVSGFDSQCSVYLGGDQQLTNLTLTLVQFDTEDYDNNSEFNVGTYTWTAADTGYYRIHANLTWKDNAVDGTVHGVLIYIDGAEAARHFDIFAANSFQSVSISREFYLTATQTVTIYGYQGTGGNYSLDGRTSRTYMSVSRFDVGDAFTVKVDSAATAGYLGAASNDGVLRTGTGITYTDGGDFVTLAVDGFSAYTDEDTDSQTLAEDHAYLAQTDGFVVATANLDDNQFISGFVGDTNDPVGAGEQVNTQRASGASDHCGITFPVPSGKYFEVTFGTLAGTWYIRWMSVGALQKPVDQD